MTRAIFVFLMTLSMIVKAGADSEGDRFLILSRGNLFLNSGNEIAKKFVRYSPEKFEKSLQHLSFSIKETKAKHVVYLIHYSDELAAYLIGSDANDFIQTQYSLLLKSTEIFFDYDQRGLLTQNFLYCLTQLHKTASENGADFSVLWSGVDMFPLRFTAREKNIKNTFIHLAFAPLQRRSLKITQKQFKNILEQSKIKFLMDPEMLRTLPMGRKSIPDIEARTTAYLNLISNNLSRIFEMKP